MNFMGVAATDVGLRKATNQDSYFFQIMNSPFGEIAFAVICDGMGGLERGEVASSSVTRAFADWLQNRLKDVLEQGISDAVIRQEWDTLLSSYNEKIRLYGKRAGISLGTTACVLLILQDRYYIVNVGDSRAYLLHLHHHDELCQLTKDQTVVQREVDMGLLSPEQAETDSRQNILLQCIGASEQVYPDFYFGKTEENSMFLLCTDGFRHRLHPQEITESLIQASSGGEQGLKAGIVELIERNKMRQEQDNITALVIQTY